MNYWVPNTIAELKADAKFSADFLTNEAEAAFKDLNSISEFVSNWESFLMNNCYFDENKKSWFIELENKLINVSSLYTTTFKVYEAAKQFLISLNLYSPLFYGYEKLTAHYYSRDGE